MDKVKEMKKLLDNWKNYCDKNGGSAVNALRRIFEEKKIINEEISDKEFIEFINEILKNKNNR